MNRQWKMMGSAGPMLLFCIATGGAQAQNHPAVDAGIEEALRMEAAGNFGMAGGRYAALAREKKVDINCRR